MAISRQDLINLLIEVRPILEDKKALYLMNRQGMAEGESIVLHYTPSQLVGQYFEVV